MTNHQNQLSQPQTTRSCATIEARELELPSNPLLATSRRASSRMLIFTTFVSLLVSPSFAFTTAPSFRRTIHTTPSTLHASRSKSGGGVAQPVKPRSSISPREREEAIKAMDRKRAEEALSNVDAQMLELLSDQFLYPSKPAEKRQRPKGRPDSVPGAMTYETLLKFREQTEQRNGDKTQPLSTIQPYSSPSTFSEEPRKARKERQSRVRGITTASEETSTRKRKKVVKNLPERKQRTEPLNEREQVVTKKIYKAPKNSLKRAPHKGPDNIDLQKYYRTELLTPKEEYSLGMQVHFMVKCEEVHEGLCIRLMRLPTMKEWAEACGFTEEDPTYVEAEGDSQVRPAGADSLFAKSDPTMFVGNGLATEAGPGRGRGRAKKAPPSKLDDYYDDSEERFLTGKLRKEPSKKKTGRLVNRGTVTDFVNTLFDAREAKQHMVQSNMRLVVSIARKYSNVGVNLQDLVQEGSLGLTRAAEKFEPTKGFKFSTYASWWIQQAVFRSIAYHSRTIRLPVHVHNLLNRVRKIKMSLEQELGRTPTNEEMAQQLDMSTKKYNKMMHLTRRSISLELPKYQSNPKDLGHESEDLLGDTIASTTLQDDNSCPEKRVDRALFHEDLREMLKVLEEDERRVISARYGLSDGLTRTVTAVAAQMKQTKAWVRSKECRALRKLRRPWYEQRLKEHQNSLTS